MVKAVEWALGTLLICTVTGLGLTAAMVITVIGAIAGALQ